MPVADISRLYDLISDLSDRISELEKKIEDWEFTDEAQEVLGRIEKLEKKIFHDYGGDLNKIEDAAIVQIELVKKVLKLEEWQDKSWNMHQEMAQEILPNQLEILEKQISELKEQEYLNAGEIRNCKQDFHELREVLREQYKFKVKIE